MLVLRNNHTLLLWIKVSMAHLHAPLNDLLLTIIFSQIQWLSFFRYFAFSSYPIKIRFHDTQSTGKDMYKCNSKRRSSSSQDFSFAVFKGERPGNEVKRVTLHRRANCRVWSYLWTVLNGLLSRAVSILCNEQQSG